MGISDFFGAVMPCCAENVIFFKKPLDKCSVLWYDKQVAGVRRATRRVSHGAPSDGEMAELV